MWRSVFDVLESIGEGGIVFLVVCIVFFVAVLPMIIDLSRMAG